MILPAREIVRKSAVVVAAVGCLLAGTGGVVAGTGGVVARSGGVVAGNHGVLFGSALGLSGGSSAAARNTPARSPAAGQDTTGRPRAQFRYVRFATPEGEVSYGLLRGLRVEELDGELFSGLTPTGRTFAVTDVRLRSPINPESVRKVLGVADNVRVAGAVAAHPRWFAKLPTTLAGPGDPVELPPDAADVGYEGELVVVIGRGGRFVPVEEALDHVFGVTVGAEFGERSWFQETAAADAPGRLIGAAADGWAPIGPAIVTGIDFSDLRVEVRLNGAVAQSGRTSELAASVPELIAYLSRYVTLEAGDLIFAGTVGRIEGARSVVRPDDVVEVEIDGLGTLRNRVAPIREGR